jgi:glucose-1-phosphate thymidylyltransferase
MNTSRKGIILAGGSGTRLYPVTHAICKQLLPVYDKPMVYYALSTLMIASVRDILIISTPADTPRFEQMLGNGRNWGIHLSYAVQPAPDGIAQALIIAEPFLAGSPCALILGDNIFYGHDLAGEFAAAGAAAGATIFCYLVDDPQRYGVVEFDAAGGVASIAEKPQRPRSPYAVTGMYFYDEQAPSLAQSLKPSERGELEITDLNNLYLAAGKLNAVRLGRGHAWLDTGTHDSLLDASAFVHAIEKRQGLKVCCPEEIAWRMGYISASQLEALATPLKNSGYGAYLLRILEQEATIPARRASPS